MKKCQICGEIVTDSSKYCPKCGAELAGCSETIEGEVVENVVNVNEDKVLKESIMLRDEFARKASTNLTLSIVSIVLCCCTITSIISLVMSIILMLDLKKLSEETKTTEDYRRVRNKNLIAMIIAIIILVMGLINTIDSIVNYDEYQQMISSILNNAYYE